MKKIVFLLLSILLLSGCSAKQPLNSDSGVHPFELVLNEGYSDSLVKLPFHAGLIAFRKGKYNEFEMEPLDMNSSLTISRDIDSLVIRFWIKNESEVNYYVWKEYDVFLDNKKIRTVSKKLWAVNLKENFFEIHCPLYPEGARIGFRVVIKNKANQTIFWANRFSYKVGLSEEKIKKERENER